MRFFLHILITAAALWVAVQIVSGIQFTGTFMGLLGVALIFGAVNAIVRPIVKLLSLPFIILTLGLFSLVINALLFLLVSVLSQSFGLGFHVTGFIPALLGSLVVSAVSLVLSLVAGALGD